MWPVNRFIGVAMLITLLAGLGILAQPRPAGALDLAVSPVQVYLAADKKSAILNVTNPNKEAITIQVSVFTWSQDPTTGDQLDPTQDLLVFPQMLNIKPGASRNIRVGTTETAPQTERTFRLLLEPVVTPKKPSEEQGSTGTATFTIVTRASVPVFIQPAKANPAPLRTALTADHGKLFIHVTNPGPVHVPPPGYIIKGYTAREELALEGEKRGWYVLAGATRTETIPIPADKCPSLRRLLVEVRSGQQTDTATIPVPPDFCQVQ
ncbi:MAG: molecular chaperone [Candidatus Methylomirabilales bacterium]